MTWPTTPASTANCDQGTDRIADARADIKQNIDNVNAIIDEFNISSPSNGDILRYSSSSGKWEQVSSTLIGAPQVIITLSGNGSNVSGSLARFTADIVEVYDPANISSISGNVHNLTAGSYFIQMLGTNTSSTSAPPVTSFPRTFLFDPDLNADIDNIDQVERNGSFTILEADTALDDFKIQYQLDIVSGRPYNFASTLKMIKIA